MEWLRNLFARADRGTDSSNWDGDETLGRKRPPLVVLVPDAGSTVSFKVESFPDIAEAETFLNFWFTPGQLASLVVYWALNWEPKPSQAAKDAPPAEPIVLIRDPRRPGFAFPFSFSDMSAAEGFLRNEMEQGADYSLFSLYWAAPVRTQIDARGNICLDPKLPPLPTRVNRNLERALYTEARAEAERARQRKAAEANVKRTIERTLRDSGQRKSRRGDDSEQVTQAAYDHFRREIESLGEFDPPKADSPELAPMVKQAIDQILAGASHLDGPEERRDGPPDPRQEMSDELKRMQDELERFRRRWRFLDRDEPFHGFDSPPGKF